MVGVAIDLEELADFLVFAKNSTYAGDGKKITRPDGSKKFVPVVRGPLRYEDEYEGRAHFGGRTRVYSDEKILWHMFYSGGITKEFRGDPVFRKEVYAFLKKAILAGDKKSPFRGPDTFTEGDFAYFNNTIKGDIADFKGREEIWHKEEQIYVLRFIGGIIE